jgi:cytochrome c-type biogenesis protein CcmH/NrfG
MKRGNTFWGILLVVMLAACLIVSLKIGQWRVVRVPEKIIPAAVTMPSARHPQPEEQERGWLRTGLRVLERRLDSLVADSVKNSIIDHGK